MASIGSVKYDLSQYWVELYYLNAGDSIVLPNAAPVPARVLTWIQNITDEPVKKALEK